jgi:hypothetical protein
MDMEAETIKLEEVSDVELGAEGVRVTWRNGERKFIEGQIGFDLYRSWMEYVKSGEPE